MFLGDPSLDPIRSSSRFLRLMSDLRVEALIASGAARERLRAAVQAGAPDHLETLARLFDDVDRER